MSLGLDLSTLLSDLAAHSSVSSALRAPSCCFLQGTASVSGCLDPPRSSAMPLLALGQHLIRLSFLWIMVAFCFPPFAIHLARSSFFYLFCCSQMWSHCWVSLPIPVAALLPLLASPGYWKERTACACTMPFMARILNDQ